MGEAYSTYKNTPILLNPDTLRNPIAMQYAELLSIRTPRNSAEMTRINSAVKEVNSMYNACIEEYYDPVGAGWCRDVERALRNKTKMSTVSNAIANDTLWGIPRLADSVAAATTKDNWYAQTHYLTSYRYSQEANPKTAMEINQALEVLGIADTGFGLAKAAIKEGVKGFIGELVKAMAGGARDFGVEWFTNKIE